MIDTQTMDALPQKAKNKVKNQNIQKESERSVNYYPQFIESQQDKRDFENTTTIDFKNENQQGKTKIQFNGLKFQNINKMKWGSLKKFLYKRRILLNRQMNPPVSQTCSSPSSSLTSLQQVQTELSVFSESSTALIPPLQSQLKVGGLNMNVTNNEIKSSSNIISSISTNNANNNIPYQLKGSQEIAGNAQSTDGAEIIQGKQQTIDLDSASCFIAGVSSPISQVQKASISQVQSTPLCGMTISHTASTASKQQNNTSNPSNQLSSDHKKNIISTCSASSAQQYSKEKKLISVKTEKKLNFLVLRRINKQQLNSTMSDDQQSYEEEYYRKASSSFRNICDSECISLEQKRLITSETSYSFLESSYKSNNGGYTNFLFSPSLNNSEILEECCVPERCQNPLSKDIQFLNLANQESNFEELKKKILFDEELFDFTL